MNTKDGQNDGWSLTKDPPLGDPISFLSITTRNSGFKETLMFRKLKHGTSKQFARH